MRNTNVSLLAPEALTTTKTGSAIDVSGFHGLCDIILNSTAMGGSSTPKSVVKLTHCDTSGGTYADVAGAVFADVTDTAGCQTIVFNADSLKKYVKVVSTLSGTSPTCTQSVVLSGKKNY